MIRQERGLKGIARHNAVDPYSKDVSSPQFVYATRQILLKYNEAITELLEQYGRVDERRLNAKALKRFRTNLRTIMGHVRHHASLVDTLNNFAHDSRFVNQQP